MGKNFSQAISIPLSSIIGSMAVLEVVYPIHFVTWANRMFILYTWPFMPKVAVAE